MFGRGIAILPLLNPDGFEIALTIPESRSVHGQLLKADLAQIGIDLTIEIVEIK